MLFYIILIILMLVVVQFYTGKPEIYSKKDKFITIVIVILFSIFIMSILCGLITIAMAVNKEDYIEAKIYKKALSKKNNSKESIFIIRKIEVYNQKLDDLKFWNSTPMLDGFISDKRLKELKIIKLDYSKIK